MWTARLLGGGRLRPLAGADITLYDELDLRLRAAAARLSARRPDPADPVTAGRWLEAATELTPLVGAAGLDPAEIGARLLETAPAGSAPAELLGLGRALAGLVAWSALAPEAVAPARLLELAERLAAATREGTVEAIRAAATGIDALVGLLERLPEESSERARLLELARLLADAYLGACAPETPSPERLTGRLDEHVLAALGLARLAQRAGAERYLAAADAFADFLDREWVWPSGGLPDRLDRARAGDCVAATADRIRLDLALFRATGGARYLDAAEWALYNHLFFQQLDDGAAAGGRSLDGRAGAAEDPPWATAALALALVAAARDTCDTGGGRLWCGLFFSSRAVVRRAGGRTVTLTLRSELPAAGRLVWEIEADPADDASLALRRPSWLDPEAEPVVRQGETPATLRLENGWIVLRLPPAQSGDASGAREPITLELPVAPRLRPAETGDTKLNSELSMVSPISRTAVVHGPLLLCLSARFNPGLDLAAPLRVEERSLRAANVFGRRWPIVAGRLRDARRTAVRFTPLGAVGGRATETRPGAPVAVEPFRVWLAADAAAPAVPAPTPLAEAVENGDAKLDSELSIASPLSPRSAAEPDFEARYRKAKGRPGPAAPSALPPPPREAERPVSPEPASMPAPPIPPPAAVAPRPKPAAAAPAAPATPRPAGQLDFEARYRQAKGQPGPSAASAAPTAPPAPPRQPRPSPSAPPPRPPPSSSASDFEARFRARRGGQTPPREAGRREPPPERPARPEQREEPPRHSRFGEAPPRPPPPVARPARTVEPREARFSNAPTPWPAPRPSAPPPPEPSAEPQVELLASAADNYEELGGIEEAPEEESRSSFLDEFDRDKLTDAWYDNRAGAPEAAPAGSRKPPSPDAGSFSAAAPKAKADREPQPRGRRRPRRRRS